MSLPEYEWTTNPFKNSFGIDFNSLNEMKKEENDLKNDLVSIMISSESLLLNFNNDLTKGT